MTAFFSGAVLALQSYLLKRLLVGKIHATELFMKQRERHGRLFQGRFFGNWFVYVMDVDAIKHIVMNPNIYIKAGEDVNPPLLSKFVGTNLVFSNGETWKKQRRCMSGAFTYDALRPLVPTFGAYGERLCAQLAGAAGAPVQIDDLLQRVTMDVLGATGFGRDFGALERSGDAVLAAYKYVLETSTSVWRFVFRLIDRLPLPSNRRIHRCIAEIDAVIYERIEACRADAAGLARPSNLLQLMVAANKEEREGKGEGLTDKELRDNMVIFFLAGHETTAVALGFALYALATHPAIQERARAEVDAVLPRGRLPTHDDLNRLEYVSRVIKEAMRLYPPVYSAPVREVAADDELLGHRVKKGTLVTIPLYAVHHDEGLWPDHAAFDPDRFLPERSAGRHPFAYLPFLAGPRTCIGNNFSLLEQRVLLSMLLSRFVVRLAPGHPPLKFSRKSVLILKPEKLDLVFEPRPA